MPSASNDAIGTRRVDFLIAGVQKAGTSALFDYLREIPGLQLPPIKEAHHFDNESLDWSEPDHDSYHALFEADGRLWGEATPIYCYWPHSIERIRAYHPAMRIILIFRNPIERAWSHWKMEFARRKETMPFAWCIRDGRARVDSDEAAGHHRVFSYVERGFYGQQLDRILRAFPREQLLLLRSEDLDTDPITTIGRVCAFLGVKPPCTLLIPRRIRIAVEMDYPSILTDADCEFLHAEYEHDNANFRQLTGWDLNLWPRVTSDRGKCRPR